MSERNWNPSNKEIPISDILAYRQRVTDGSGDVEVRTKEGWYVYSTRQAVPRELAELISHNIQHEDDV